MSKHPSNKTSETISSGQRTIKPANMLLLQRLKSKSPRSIGLIWALLLTYIIASNLSLPSSLTNDNTINDNVMQLFEHNHQNQLYKNRDQISNSINCVQKVSQPISHMSSSSCQASQLNEAPVTSATTTTTAYESLSSNLFLKFPYQCLTNFNSYLNQFYDNRHWFRPLVSVADAKSLYSTPQQDTEIILLNSKNFNQELIQYRQSLPHIKLVEYYLPFNRFCNKFKPTYTKLAKEIYSWRNVIRVSAIDIADQQDSHIAHAWSIESVPTLKMHPPANQFLAQQLYDQYIEKNSTLSPNELHKFMFDRYSDAKLTTKSFDAAQYIDRVDLFKRDILDYIDEYVKINFKSGGANQLPSTWPNLHPVTESSLKNLLNNHPRQELFLIIEPRRLKADTNPTSDYDPSFTEPHNLGLGIMMELSSSLAWKTVRYVRASENEPLMADIITQLNKTSSTSWQIQSDQRRAEVTSDSLNSSSSHNSSSYNRNLPDDDLVLIHINGAHPSIRAGNSEFSSVFSSAIVKLTARDLELIEGQLNGTSDTVIIPTSQPQSQTQTHLVGSSVRRRTARQINYASSASIDASLQSNRYRRSAEPSSEMSLSRKIDLFVKFIKQVHVSTSEDRAFVKILNNTDNDYRPSSSKVRKADPTASGKFSMTPILNQLTSDLQDNESSSASGGGLAAPSEKPSFANMFNLINPNSNSEANKDTNTLTTSTLIAPSLSYSGVCWDDTEYGDKLKALQYIFENEIVNFNKFNSRLSLDEHLARLKIVLNLISVIKAYFPMPDSSSAQFVEGIERYLVKEKFRISSALTNPHDAASSSIGVGVDSIALKKEIDRLKEDDKRLPEIKEYSHCKVFGYPCALWRVFHTLTVFEYKKLKQIREQLLQSSKLASSSSQQTVSSKYLDRQVASARDEVSSKLIINPQMQDVIRKQDNAGDQSLLSRPVEHLVSPPSTTTSLSLTIQSNNSLDNLATNGQIAKNLINEADLPTPVLLVMRSYITTFFTCHECGVNFGNETEDITIDKIRSEPAEFSLIKLWQIHNRVNKRLSVVPEFNPESNRKVWFPTYEQCRSCYKKPPSYLNGCSTDTVDSETMFAEPIEWDESTVVNFLVQEYSKNPMDQQMLIFGRKVSYQWVCITFGFGIVLILTITIRCFMVYSERQLRHKNNLANGNGARYSMELQ